MTKTYRVIAGIIGMVLIAQGCSQATPRASPLPQPTTTLSLGPEPGGPSPLTVPTSLEASPEEAAAALMDPNRVEEGVWFMLRGLGIGVYTGDGRQVLAGSEAGPTDFWIYDFEVPLLVRLAMEPSKPFSEFQPQLRDLGLDSAPEETLRLYEEVYGANPSAYLVRLFAAMDLHFEGDPEITPLQEWLMLLDTFLPANGSTYTRQGDPFWRKYVSVGILAPSRQEAALGIGVSIWPAQSQPCGLIQGGTFHANWGLVNSETGPADLMVAETMYYAIHGPLLARAVGTELRASKDHAHEGHGAPGDTISFDVVMDVDYRVGGIIPIGLPTCGYLINLDPPLKSGDLPAAQVWWRLGPEFENHGSFRDVRDHVFDGSGPTGTDASGKTGITFQARQEPANGQGEEKSVRQIVQASFDPRAWIAAMGLKDPRLLSFLPTTIDISPSVSVTLEWHEMASYEGEGKYRITGEQSGLERISGYEFLITFRADADGTIVGEGVLRKIEASMGSQDFQCNDPEVSSLTFPPMRVTGTVKPDATFQLTIVGLTSTTASQFICEHPIAGSWPLSAAPDGGFVLSDIEIAATDGAQASGEDSREVMGTTVVETWELQIHEQATP